MSGHEDVMMTEEDSVIHLQIQQNTEPPQQPGGQVFYVYYDIFSCGVCSKQYNNMLQFILHKSMHSLGLNVYKCDLCGHISDGRPTLVDHYKTFHCVDLSMSTEEDDNITDQPPLPPTPPLKPKPPESHQEKKTLHKNIKANVTKLKKQVKKTAEKQVKLEKIEENIEEQEVSVKEADEEMLRNEDDEDEESGEDVIPQDFIFVLLCETMKGAKMTYTRQWFKCLHCNFRSRIKVSLLRHMVSFHKETFTGVHDNMVVKGEEEVYADNNNPKVGETSSRVMRMSAYDRLFPITGNKRRRRLEKQDIPGKFECETCHKVFGRLRYLRKHAKQHAHIKSGKLEKPFTCEQCGKSFRFKHYLKSHLVTHMDVQKMFFCSECDFQSDVSPAIHAHRQIHTQGSVLCDICGSAYSDRSTLTKHYRVHDMSRPFACSHQGCTWRFKTESMCRAHVRGHTTQGEFRCWVCGYLFRHKHHLQRHVTKIHSVNLPAKQLDELCKPMTSRERKKKPIQCKDCGLDFSARIDLEQHLIRFHQIHVTEVEQLSDGTVILQNDENGDTKLVIANSLVTSGFSQNSLDVSDDPQQEPQPVYVEIDHGTLAQFEVDASTLGVAEALYVQEEQEVPICEEEEDQVTMATTPGEQEQTTYFVSSL